jgi:hypothetical protein
MTAATLSYDYAHNPHKLENLMRTMGLRDWWSALYLPAPRLRPDQDDGWAISMCLRRTETATALFCSRSTMPEAPQQGYFEEDIADAVGPGRPTCSTRRGHGSPSAIIEYVILGRGMIRPGFAEKIAAVLK